MSLFFRRRERRAAFAMPRPYMVYGGTSYADVDASSSMEAPLQSIAVRSTVDLIASLTSELPVDVFTGRGGRRQVTMPGYLEDPSGEGYGLEDWLYQVVESWLLRGNVYGQVLDVGPGGFPRQVDLWHPDHVSAQLDNGRPRWFLDGVEVDRDRVLHRRVNPMPGCVLGLSPVQVHAADLGLHLTLTRFGLQYFRDGAHPGAVLSSEEKIGSDAVARVVKDRFMAAVRGSREPAVLGKGWKYEAIKINPEESQFLESRGFSAAECARIFGPGFAEILGYNESGSSVTYANKIDRDLDLLKYGMNKWLRRADRLLTEMLPRPQFARLNRDAMLETSTVERYKAHALALNNKQWKRENEVRVLEDLEPDWGSLPTDMPAPPPALAPPEDEDGGDDAQ